MCLCVRSGPVLVHCNEAAGAEVVRAKGCEIASRVIADREFECVCMWKRQTDRERETRKKDILQILEKAAIR